MTPRLIARLRGVADKALNALTGALPPPSERLDTIHHVSPLAPPTHPSPPDDLPLTLRVMTWNLAWCRGADPGEAHHRVMGRAQMEANLCAAAALIRSHSPDLVLLQEVDLCAKRSASFNQLTLLARHAGLPFAAPARAWVARYLPFPYWPPSRHHGAVCAGGGVLSRFPLRQNRTILYPKPQQNPWWYNAFYPARYAQRVEALIAGRWHTLINTHLEAYDRANRTLQAARLQRLLRGLGPDQPLLCGGDLNTTPPEAAHQHAFWDEPRDDYRDDHTLPLLREVAHLRDVAPPSDAEPAWWTFPSAAPNRRLDYLLYPPHHARLVSARVVPANGLSDHRPIVATFTLGR
jgi:endonuclease/exonuclease/phosphatase family metal-dependent hydrolase